MSSNENAKANPKKLGKLRGCALILFGFSIIILIFGIISGKKEDGQGEQVKKDSEGEFTDSRDGRKYKAVKIGSQTWIAENLNYDMPGSKCYDNNPDNCNKYGRLYDWEMAMKACPNGWHLPSNKEWAFLYRFADGTSGTDSFYESPTAGKYLKATSGWTDYNGNPAGNGEDKFGFSALPGGGFSATVAFDGIGRYGTWWSSSENDTLSTYAYCQSIKSDFGQKLSDNGEGTDWGHDQKTKSLYSVRCVKDN